MDRFAWNRIGCWIRASVHITGKWGRCAMCRIVLFFFHSADSGNHSAFWKKYQKTVEQTKKEGVLSSVLYRGYLSRILRYPLARKCFGRGRPAFGFPVKNGCGVVNVDYKLSLSVLFVERHSRYPLCISCILERNCYPKPEWGNMRRKENPARITPTEI